MFGFVSSHAFFFLISGHMRSTESLNGLEPIAFFRDSKGVIKGVVSSIMSWFFVIDILWVPVLKS